MDKKKVQIFFVKDNLFEAIKFAKIVMHIWYSFFLPKLKFNKLKQPKVKACYISVYDNKKYSHEILLFSF